MATVGANCSLRSVGIHPQPAVPFECTLDGLLGFEFLETGEEEARARLTVGDQHRQPMGTVHGGAYAALAESLCSVSTLHAVSPDSLAVGQSNLTTFTRPVSDGAIEARARRKHRGRTTWVWEVDVLDDEQRLCALIRMTVAVRPLS